MTVTEPSGRQAATKPSGRRPAIRPDKGPPPARRLILEATIVRDADLAHRLMNDHLELTGEISAAP